MGLFKDIKNRKNSDYQSKVNQALGLPEEDRHRLDRYHADVEEHHRILRSEKAAKRNEKVGRTLAQIGNVMPKGIRNPDDLVVNRHLYMGRGGKGKKAKLF